MAFRIGLHNHSMYSGIECGEATLQHLLERALEANINFAVTDIGNERFWKELRDRPDEVFEDRYQVEVWTDGNVATVLDLENGKNVLTYRGIEDHNRRGQIEGEGHLLIIGHTEELGEYWNLSLQERIERGKEAGGIVVAAHPTIPSGMGRDNLERYVELLDCTEGFNSQTRTGEEGFLPRRLYEVFLDPYKYNNEAQEIAEAVELPAIATADSLSGQLELAYTILERDPQGKEMEEGIEHIEYLRREIREGRFTNEERMVSPLRFFRDYGYKLQIEKPIITWYRGAVLGNQRLDYNNRTT